MARTLDPVAHAVRRDEFLDAAQWLIQTRGYDEMSIQDVLDRVEASRGAFYHYFDSKAALLEALIERLTASGTATILPVVDDPTLGALEKFSRVFDGIARWKAERKELMLALLQVWYSDENALVRDKLWQQMLTVLTPVVAAIIEQGRGEGVFTAPSGPDTAQVILTLLYGAGETAGRLFFARHAREISVADIRARLVAYSAAVERVLGVPPASLQIVDDATLHEWFD
ncbi:MAG: TetR/AcrR family transcriptional regulator [Candidatus Dormibacteraeota bacterium]|nr:TetR/AcrR family transcriptional regulator [Candidatus Dormibacteraeota bacterium]